MHSCSLTCLFPKVFVPFLFPPSAFKGLKWNSVHLFYFFCFFPEDGCVNLFYSDIKKQMMNAVIIITKINRVRSAPLAI